MTKKSADAIRAEWEANIPNPEAMEVTPPTPIQEAGDTEMPDSTQPPKDQDMDTKGPSDNKSVMTDDSDAKQSAFQQRLNVPTNDGTMRITVRWTPADKQLSHIQNPGKWATSALTMLQELFPDAAGLAYRWESQDLATWSATSTMQPDELRDYLSPNITHISSKGMYIFGFRFGFTARNPVSWKQQTSTRDAMRKHQVWATESNSSCTSGELCNAGFILMKAPNLTHTVRYLQSLRNRLPENTPFFDIVLVRRTPLEQPINHLAVRCGENHVAPLSKAISALLTGTGGAIFLPRVVLGNLSKDQITKYFTAHDNYVKSLRSICLSPRITNLDTIREEFFDNGEVLKRTTREWATKIQLSKGTSARCDIVNGGKDLAVYLLVPSHVYAEVNIEVSKYKLRLNPMERREARFRDSLPGLPDVIQIDTAVQASLDCLEMLSAEDIWKRAPPEVRNQSAPKAAARATPTTAAAVATLSHAARKLKDTASILTDLSDGEVSESDSEGSRNPQSGSKSSKHNRKQSKHKKKKMPSNPTQQATVISTLTSSQEFQDMLQKIQDQQDQLDEGLQETTQKFEAMEVKLDALKRLDSMETNINLSMKYHLKTSATLKLLHKNQQEILDMIGDIAEDAKHRKLQRQARSISQQLQIPQASTDTQRDSVLAMDSESTDQPSSTLTMVDDQPPAAALPTSLELALRERGTLIHVANPTMPKKQKSAHAATADLDEVGGLDIPAGFPTAEDIPPPLTNPEDLDIMYPTIPMTADNASAEEETMEFASDDDATSMNTAPTDLDDQYNFSPDPDGGEPD